MRYEGVLYRPPSEALSLIIQATVGCSHNKCSFCSMYKGKRFHIRQFEDIEKDLLECRRYYSNVKRIFLADGDALCLSVEKLLKILNAIKLIYPECERVGIYAAAKDILRKTPEQLRLLNEAGIGIVYIGAESGSPQVLKKICKNADREELIDSVLLAEDCGMAASVTLISGMGGRALLREHAEMSASLVNAMHPSYVSLLTLMIDKQAPIYDEIQSGEFELLSPFELLEEAEMFVENIKLSGFGKSCVFRSNHASNYLSLKGNLPEDKERLLREIRNAMEDPDLLRPEYFRAL